jgi:hypothetical protein
VRHGQVCRLDAADGNPLDDLSALKREVFVMRGGEIAHNTLDAAFRERRPRLDRACCHAVRLEDETTSPVCGED